MRKSLPFFAVALTLAACANDRGPSGHSGPPPQHGQGDGPPPEGEGEGGHNGGPSGGKPGQNRPARGALFISPMGEPFRGTEGGAPMQRWLAGADTNNDGQLSSAEFNQDALRFFTALDVNGDGRINADEIKRYEELVAPEVHSAGMGGGGGEKGGGEGGRGGGGSRGGGGGGKGGGGGGGGGHKGGGGNSGSSAGSVSPDYAAVGAARFGLLAIPQPVSSADSNFDGSVSQIEFTRAAAQRFALLDTNANGTLTRDELTRDQ